MFGAFGVFSTQLMNNYDEIDAIAERLTAINDMDATLDTPEAKRILQMNNDIVDYHQQYDDMVSKMT
ncbi:uncharacterized protein N7487_012091 [Penicillium crustosum]|uniref:uncharacterized protein n=1 Tax=Penicillium crustosum TaxID=36656 RepID=UPI00239FD13E|nr:uncharacterized protein N7487_012091 [Penicillium crustosum]KAJ5394450.1 hypothetical protein N7487_012091 [Penicillium crustosum]